MSSFTFVRMSVVVTILSKIKSTNVLQELSMEVIRTTMECEMSIRPSSPNLYQYLLPLISPPVQTWYTDLVCLWRGTDRCMTIVQNLDNCIARWVVGFFLNLTRFKWGRSAGDSCESGGTSALALPTNLDQSWSNSDKLGPLVAHHCMCTPLLLPMQTSFDGH